MGTRAPADLQAVTVGQLPSWGPGRIDRLEAVLLDAGRPFPCVFAVSATRKSALRFGFIDDVHDSRTWHGLHDILRAYLDDYKSIARDTSLIVFFGGHRDGLDETFYRRRFWEVLQYLHDTDTTAWPDDLPADGDDPMWEFSYAGEPIFVVCNTPAHDQRLSRHSDEFMITFQPRWVFEGIESDSPRGVAVRRGIRKRLREFDNAEPSVVLGNYGDPANREWQQYFLDNTERSASELSAQRCPFRPRTRPGDSAAPAEVPGRRWSVVVNRDGYHSVWPARRPVPRGWTSSGVFGDRATCLSHVREVWKDMRPASVRTLETDMSRYTCE